MSLWILGPYGRPQHSLVCVASLGWKIAFFECVEPFNCHDLKILGSSRYWDHVEVESHCVAGDIDLLSQQTSQSCHWMPFGEIMI